MCGYSFLSESSPSATGSMSPLQRSAPVAIQDKISAARPPTDSERKPVTILFADIVESYSLAEKPAPEEWAEIISGVHRIIGETVNRYGGTIAKHLGDGVLAFFGAPVAHEDDPARAVRAALDGQGLIGDYARSLEGSVDKPRMRFGVNTGTVVVGNFDPDSHIEYFDIDDSVNLAARLQSEAQPGMILLSETTAHLVSSVFDLRELGEISVTGNTEPVKIFQVLRSEAKAQAGRGIEGLTSPLVGREKELQRLSETLDTLREGSGQVVILMGEAGIGKCRLVDEVRRSGETGTASPSAESGSRVPLSVKWLEGRSLSFGQTLSFWPIRQLLKADLGLAEADPEPKIRDTLRQRMSSLFGERAADPMPFLLHLLGITPEGDAEEQVRLLGGETLRRQILLAVADYFARVAQEAPTVLVLRDLQWADPSTLEALEQLLPITDRVPLMLLLVSRDARDHGSSRIELKAETDYAHRCLEINLSPLSDDDSNRLIDNLLESADLPQPFRRVIVDRSEGNPFYLEEVVRSLIEQGAIVHDGQTWRAPGQNAPLAVPETVQGVLLERISRLEENVRLTLQLASVIGTDFPYRLLEAVAEAGRELDSHLARLQRAEFLREKTGGPEVEYFFRHSLTQEAAYKSLPIERRQEFHGRVSVALEKSFDDRKEEFYGLLAHHFDAGGDREKTVDYLVKAGDKSRHIDAVEEAICYYKRAVELYAESGNKEEAARMWLKLGLIYQGNIDLAAANQAYETAFALQREVGASRRQLRQQLANEPSIILRFGDIPSVGTLEPGREQWENEVNLVSNIFAGLAEIDAELNLVPHVASSWEALDGGTRYLVHLRDDVRWTDGTAVTAHDFEWAWKRNLAPSIQAPSAPLLNDIVGAREYCEGRSSDPDSIGVCALDDLTLQVRLLTPAAYFPYLFAHTVTLPLLRSTVERFGDKWWRPDHIVSNGPFRLVQFDGVRGALERNRDYFGEFFGNVDRVEWRTSHGRGERLRDYLEGKCDYCQIRPDEVPETLMQSAAADVRSALPALATLYLIFSPEQPPMGDIRVRRALVQAIDWQLARDAWHERAQAREIGGIVPPGMPGHSPGIALPFDLETARRLLAEAGYPEGRGCPPILLGYPIVELKRYLPEIVRQWRDHLGLEVQMGYDPANASPIRPHVRIGGWAADYPDPDNFLRNSSMFARLSAAGWQDPRYLHLVEEAARTPDRARRLEMYREADRIWVSEQAVICPIRYEAGSPLITLVKPWVKNLMTSPLNIISLKNVTVEPH